MIITKKPVEEKTSNKILAMPLFYVCAMLKKMLIDKKVTTEGILIQTTDVEFEITCSRRKPEEGENKESN